MPTPATARWSTLVSELAASGQSVRDFCAPRGLNPKTLSWWRWNLGHQDKAPQASVFMELSVVPERAPAHREPLLVELPEAHVHLHITHSTDLNLLRRVVEALC